MKRWLIPLMTLAVLAGFLSAVLAANEQIYIHNQVFNGRVVREGGKVWLDVDDFLNAARLPKTVLKSGIVNGMVAVALGNRKGSVAATMRADGMYIDGQAFVEQLGGRWLPNSGLGLIDVAVPVAAYSRPTASGGGDATASTSASPGAAPPAASGDQKVDPKKGPIIITNFEWVDPTLPGKVANTQVHGKVVIKNTADMVDGVEIIVHLQDGYEKDIDTIKKDLGPLEGGADYTFEFTWQNYNAFVINPLAEVVSNKYYSKADREQMAKDKKEIPKDEKKASVTSRATAGLPTAPALGGASGGYENTNATPPAAGYQAPTSTPVAPGAGAGETPPPDGSTPPVPSQPPGFGPASTSSPGGTEGSSTPAPTAPPGF